MFSTSAVPHRHLMETGAARQQQEEGPEAEEEEAHPEEQVEEGEHLKNL